MAMVDTGTGRSSVRRAPIALACLAALGASPSAFGQATGVTLPSGSNIGPIFQAPVLASGNERETYFLPGIRATQHYSTNPLRLPDGQERGGWITEVTPFVSTGINSQRLQGELDYQARAFYRTVGEETDLRHNLRARGNALLIGNWFGIQGSAAVFDTVAAPFGVQSFDPGLTGVNRSAFKAVTLTPYLQGRFGSFADYRAQYSFTYNDGPSQFLISRVDQRLGASLTSGPQFNRWGWSWAGEFQRREFRNGAELDRVSSVGRVWWLVQPELRIGALVAYEQIDRLLNRDGDDRGWGPGAFFDWTPTSRTTVRGEASRQYYGTTWNASASHRTERFTFGLSHNRSVVTSADASALVFNPGSLFTAGGFSPNLNPVFQQLVLQNILGGFGIPLGGALVSDAAVLNRFSTASVGYVGPRASGALTAFQSTRETLVNIQAGVFGGGGIIGGGTPSTTFSIPGRLETRGVSLDGTYRLDAATTVSAGARLLDQESQPLNAKSRLYQLNTGVRTQVAARTFAGAGLRYTEQRPLGGTSVAGSDDLTVFGSVEFLF